MIRVRPANLNRRRFAAWASKNKVRTVSSADFAVPEHLFADIPAKLLAGALVDGRRRDGAPEPPAKPVRRAPKPPARKTAQTANPGVAAAKAKTTVVPAARVDPNAKPAAKKAAAKAAPKPTPTPAPTPQPETPPVAEAAELEPVTGPEAPPVTYTLPDPDPEREAGHTAVAGPETGDEHLDQVADDPADPDVGTPPRAPEPALPGVHTCPEPGCGRTYKSEHGLKIHTGRAHNNAGE